MKTTKFGNFAVVHSHKLESGRYRHVVRNVNAPGRTYVFRKLVYSLSEVPKLTWKAIQQCSTIFLGQLVVTSFRDAIDSGQITRRKAQQISAECKGKYGRGLYTDRSYQHMAIDLLFQETGDLDHYWHDARIKM